MSSIGNGVAAAVAQTALQSQQVARQRDQSHSQGVRDAQRLRDLQQTHINALEEGEEYESPAQLHIDSHLPQHQSPDQQARRDHSKRKPDTTQLAQDDSADSRAAEDGKALSKSPSADGPPAETPLYRHLDIQA